MSEESLLAVDPAAGSTLLAAMLGYYWSVSSKDGDRRSTSRGAV
jgi:hypothetical protein